MSTSTLEKQAPASPCDDVLSPDLHDPVEAAKAAGLRYVSDERPGITRVKQGDDWVYVDVHGQTIEDQKTLDRIKKLAIPPAYTHVWICAQANGHLQATGRDAKGRKQYRYHAKWREVRDENKFGHMIDFGQALPKIRARVEQDLSLRGMPRDKVLATVVRLLETTLIRVGNEEYAKTNHSYGLTTMQRQHVDVDGSVLHFHFRGKSGKDWTLDLKDRKLASIVRKSYELPGQDLFEYIDEHGDPQAIDSSDVNNYLHEIAGNEFTAKDFRTWAGTVLASLALQEFEKFDSMTQAKKNVLRAIEDVSKRLGNTPAICRKCYIHPAVLDSYLDGRLAESLQQLSAHELTENLESLRPEEAAVLGLLQTRLQQPVRL